jgi:hypothetical protein
MKHTKPSQADMPPELSLPLPWVQLITT